MSEMVMVLGTPAQVEASRMTSDMAARTVARPRMVRGPRALWQRATVDAAPGMPCPEGSTQVYPYYDPWGRPLCRRVSAPQPRTPADCMKACNLVWKDKSSADYKKCMQSCRPVRAPNAHLSRYWRQWSDMAQNPGGLVLTQPTKAHRASAARRRNPIDWAAESRLVATSSYPGKTRRR